MVRAEGDYIIRSYEIHCFIHLRAESGTFAHAARNKDSTLRPGRAIK